MGVGLRWGQSKSVAGRPNDFLGGDPRYAPAGEPRGVPSIAPGDHDDYVLGRPHYWDEVVRVGFVDPGRPVAVPVVGDALQQADRHPGVLIDVLPDIGLGKAGSGDFRGVFRQSTSTICAPVPSW